ncbi:RCC1-like domain-containing protein [Microbacterium testaceum]|uniref:RCC1 repeat-containing protein n=1 Tax=Microbacterium testaceum TaxID=2033 RepID=A0A2T7WUC0_MICTE|nr:Ig-like domain-containing protein [Microbacterium testaceum]PVE77738.1 RCC1 repeat-containing protein [Microbacterium testaceum]
MAAHDEVGSGSDRGASGFAGDGSGVGRRTVLAGAAWAVPVVSMMAVSPAFAASGGSLSLSSPGMRVQASGAVTVTAVKKGPTGQPVAGAPVSFSGPAGSSFSPASATTDGGGSAGSQFDLKTPWAKPGSTVTLSAISGADNAAGSFSVIGSNLAVAGMAYSVALAQSEAVFPSPVVNCLASSADSKTNPWWFMVLLEDGTVWTRGANIDGQLGDGTTKDRLQWGPVPGISGVKQIAASAATPYVLLADGSVKAWGYNAHGELGDGTTTTRLTPDFVSGLTSGVTQIAGGAGHAFALMSDGSVRAWGYNTTGQVGDGSATSRLTPVQVVGLTSGVTQVAASGFSSYALLSDGSVRAWGYNNDGELGDGTQTERRTPVQVSGLTAGVTQIATQAFTAHALMSDGSVKGWGYSGKGEVGDGSTATLRLTPVALPGLTSGVKQLGGGVSNGFALMTDGSLKAWGVNDQGQLGDGTTTDQPTPIDITLPAGQVVKQLARCGTYKTAMLMLAENPLTVSTPKLQVAAAGAVAVTAVLKDLSGRPVQGASVSFSGPAGSSFSSVSATTDASGAASTQLDLKTPWAKPGSSVTVGAKSSTRSASAVATVLGSNLVAAGQAYSSSVAQSELVFPSPVVDATSGGADSQANPSWSLVLLEDGTVWSKGGNPVGQLGDGSTTDRPTWAPVAGLSGVTQIADASRSGFALLSDGSVKAWGYNGNGELGDGTQNDRYTPVQVTGLTSGVTQLAAGAGQVYALLSDGSVRAWGYNSEGQLGNGTVLQDSYVPVQVSGLTSGVTQVAAGGFTGYAVMKDGSLRAWGYNRDGEVGDGTTTNRPTPVQVSGLGSAVTQVAAQSFNAFALLADGSVHGWGYSGSGELGSGSAGVAPTSPVQVVGLTSGVTQIAAGFQSGYALLSDGSVKAWGRNVQGQIGDGTTTDRPSPVAVRLPAGQTVKRLATTSCGSRTALIVMKTN